MNLSRITKASAILVDMFTRMWRKSRSIHQCKTMEDGFVSPSGSRGSALALLLEGKGLKSAFVLMRRGGKWDRNPEKPQIGGILEFLIIYPSKSSSQNCFSDCRIFCRSSEHTGLFSPSCITKADYQHELLVKKVCYCFAYTKYRTLLLYIFLILRPMVS